MGQSFGEGAAALPLGLREVESHIQWIPPHCNYDCDLFAPWKVGFLAQKQAEGREAVASMGQRSGGALEKAKRAAAAPFKRTGLLLPGLPAILNFCRAKPEAQTTDSTYKSSIPFIKNWSFGFFKLCSCFPASLF